MEKNTMIVVCIPVKLRKIAPLCKLRWCTQHKNMLLQNTFSYNPVAAAMAAFLAAAVPIAAATGDAPNG